MSIQDLRWLRCACCYSRRYVVPSENWPSCCGKRMDQETQESGLRDRGSLEPRVTDAASDKRHESSGNLLFGDGRSFGVGHSGFNVPDSGGGQSSGPEGCPSSYRENSSRSLGLVPGGRVDGHPPGRDAEIPDELLACLEHTRAEATALGRAQERLNEGVRLLLGAATTVLMLAEHVQAQQRCVAKLAEMREGL